MQKKSLKISRNDVFGDRNLPLDVSTWKNHPDYPLHIHDFSEIAIILEGSGINRVGDQEFPLAAGNVFVIHGTRPHAYLKTKNLTVTNITFDPLLLVKANFGISQVSGYQALFVVEPALRKRGKFKRYMSLNIDQLIKVRALIDVMERELENLEEGYEIMVTGHFLILVSLLSRWYGSRPAGPADAQKIMMISRAIGFMEANFGQSIDLDEMVDEAKMSRRNFHRIFKEVTGVTPLAYLLRLRIMNAVHLLEMTNKNITEIAFESGFSDSNYFSRQFKQILGFSPKEFKLKFDRTK
jgi:AraC family L-rhamnose operon transcriptional activator RhaR